MSRARHKKSGGGVSAGATGNTKVQAEAKDKTDTFKKGGKVGQKAGGKKSKGRPDKPMRRASGGRTVMSSAAKVAGRPGGNYSGKPNDKRDD